MFNKLLIFTGLVFNLSYSLAAHDPFQSPSLGTQNNSNPSIEIAAVQTKIFKLKYRSPKQIKEKLIQSKLLSEKSIMLADNATNLLFIRSTPAQLKILEDSLKLLDIPTKKILIEARLVTVLSSISNDLGVRWGFNYSRGNLRLGSNLDQITNNKPPGLAVDMGVFDKGASRIALGIKSGNSALLALELSALQSQGQAEIISQPKILTNNGVLASIKSGQEIAFRTLIDDKIQTSFKDVVLSLDVTPSLKPNGSIAMDLKIKQDSLGETSANGLPSINKNELSTSVILADGETIVLGGIFQNQKNKTETKTPLLGDIPWLGALFRGKRQNSIKKELLVFITPTLVTQAQLNKNNGEKK